MDGIDLALAFVMNDCVENNNYLLILYFTVCEKFVLYVYNLRLVKTSIIPARPIRSLREYGLTNLWFAVPALGVQQLQQQF